MSSGKVTVAMNLMADGTTSGHPVFFALPRSKGFMETSLRAAKRITVRLPTGNPAHPRHSRLGATRADLLRLLRARRGLWIDATWQLHCRFGFEQPPAFNVEPDFRDHPWYRFMENTWPLHQLVMAAVLYSLGGMSWAVWGVAVRVAVSVTSHWVVTYFAHNPGPGHWLVRGAAVRATNLQGWAFLTHGEGWHNNHHAFPESARMGVEPGQLDPGWLVLVALRGCGLVSRIGLPRQPEAREDLTPQYRAPPASRTVVAS